MIVVFFFFKGCLRSRLLLLLLLLLFCCFDASVVGVGLGVGVDSSLVIREVSIPVGWNREFWNRFKIRWWWQRAVCVGACCVLRSYFFVSRVCFLKMRHRSG